MLARRNVRGRKGYNQVRHKALYLRNICGSLCFLWVDDFVCKADLILLPQLARTPPAMLERMVCSSPAFHRLPASHSYSNLDVSAAITQRSRALKPSGRSLGNRLRCSPGRAMPRQ
jgi:hypothetical protein